jgi:integration host factor subunit beta
MTKAELVEEVARAAELNKRDAEVIVETVFDSIIGALHKGEKVELRGFGSFRTRERGPRRGRNPKTGEPVDVPAKRVPYFKPGKELKEYFTEEPGSNAEEGADLVEPISAPMGEPLGEPRSIDRDEGESQSAGATESRSAGTMGGADETQNASTGGSGETGASYNTINSSTPPGDATAPPTVAPAPPSDAPSASGDSTRVPGDDDH